MQNRLTWTIDPGRLGLLLILVGTLINGCFASLSYEYAPDAKGPNGLVHGTFLADPQDLHADLVETALAFPPFVPIDVSSWPACYQKYALRNAYHSFDLSHGEPIDVSSKAMFDENYDGQMPADRLDSAPSQRHTILSGLHVTPLWL